MKERAFVIFILVLFTVTCLPFDGRLCTDKKPCILFLDTSLTFYVVSIPNPICLDGVGCHSIYKIALLKDSTYKEFPYKITGLTIGVNSEIKNLGYLRQDLKTNKIIWKRIIFDNHFEAVELQDIAEQTQYIFRNNKVEDNDKIMLISQILSEHLNLNEIDKYFNFIVRIFSYKTEPKEVIVDRKNSGIVGVTDGGSSYRLLAIELKDKFVFKDDHFQLYKGKINNN